MKIDISIPSGVSGDFEIAHYTNETTDKRWPLYLLHTNESYDNYTVLLKEGCDMPIMQDSEAEYNDHQWLWDNAEGDIFIGGLGIGLVNHVLIDNPNITSITIVEKYQDVIDLVWEHCAKDERFNLIHADIETWEIPTDSQWDIGFFDTWLSDNDWSLKEYKNNMIDKYSPHITQLSGWGW